MSTTRTDKDMELSGAWVKAGKHHGKTAWNHVSGATVRWDCMAWTWVATAVDGTETGRWTALWMARAETERNNTAMWSDAEKVGA